MLGVERGEPVEKEGARRRPLSGGAAAEVEATGSSAKGSKRRAGKCRSEEEAASAGRRSAGRCFGSAGAGSGA
ncbi:hypothetical protein B0H17DRAFT_1081543, partial [Mycena rosella]